MPNMTGGDHSSRCASGTHSLFTMSHLFAHDGVIRHAHRGKLVSSGSSLAPREPSLPQGCARHPKDWWRQTGSNRRPHACKARALPTELCPLRTFARAEGSQGRLAVRAHARASQGDGRRRRRLRQPETMVGLGRLERPTSPLSGVRSNHLSYRPSMTDAHR